MGILGILLLAACGGVADPRGAIVAGLGDTPAPRPRADAERALLLGRLPVACTLLRARAAHDGEEEDWRLLLRAGARAHSPACLSDADGDALSAWAEGREGWLGARAEWAAARGDLAGAVALLGPTGEDGARLRVALATGDGDRARDAAEGALVESPGDVLACHTLGLAALEEGDASWAIDLAECGGVGQDAPELRRLRAEALDRAGERTQAEAAWRAEGADVHLAALLYQEAPDADREAEATRLLAAAGEAPPAALHRLWMAVLTGRPPDVTGLDESVPARLARALTRGAPADEAAIAELSGAEAAIVRARLAARRGARDEVETELAAALEAAPASEPVHRARVALRHAVGGDVDAALADWEAQDPDHVAAVGARGSRDLPWRALVPERWEDLAALLHDARARADAPRGQDAIGAEIRRARALPTEAARADALAGLAHRVQGLDGLVRERYLLLPPAASMP